MVGFGGIYVEVLRDTAARLAPFDADEALAMVDELRIAPLLRGARRRSPADLTALAHTISRFARLSAHVPHLQELEINPLLVGPESTIAVDVRGTLT
jgi:acetyltransferase